MPRKTLRIGFIGAGGIAAAQADSLKKFADAEIVAACDVNPAGLQAFGTRYGVTSLFERWNDMLKTVEMDAVTVCTPNALHCKPTVDALNAGCHVLVEKPMAMNAKEAERMIRAAKKNKRQLVIGFQHRFDGRVRAIRRAFDQGVFGKILFARIQGMRRRGIPNWGVFGRKELQGGGPLIDLGVHVLEMTHYAVGCPEPVSAVGSMWTYMGNKPSDTVCEWPNWDYKTYTVEDLAVGHIRFKNGAVFHLESSFVAHIEKGLWTFQIMGEKGGATLDPPAIFQDQAGTMMNSTPAYVPKPDVFHQKMRHFVDVCLYGKKCEAPAEHGLVVQKMLDAIYASAEEGGREVRIA